MRTLMVYSESGGVTKTTTAVSLAMTAALAGHKTLLVDLDPRAAATKWLDLEPQEGLHVGAILADEDPEGWAEDLAMATTWHENLRMIPSSRSVSNREADRLDHAETRLKASLEGLDVDVVIIDCPNRQGGPLTMAALTASDAVIYASSATVDGVDGVDGARRSVAAFRKARARLGAPSSIEEAGIVVGGVKNTIMSRAAVASLDDLKATGLFLDPLIPERTIVQETRISGEWYGNYTKGHEVAAAYAGIGRKVL